MKPESRQTEQSFNLPEPQEEHPESLSGLENPGSTSASETASALAIEGGQATSDPSLSLTTNSPSVNSTDSQLPTTSDLTGIANIAQTAPSATPLIADDGDLIEKEWVEKAKDIVNRTKHDPYMQNEEIKRVKADYLKKRYNKDIKLNEDL